MSTDITAELQEEITAEFIRAFQAKSVIPYFVIKNLKHIGIEKWLHMKINDIPEAALTQAGYNPSKATLGGVRFGDMVYTVSEEIAISEKQMAIFETIGLDKEAIQMLAEKIAALASRYLWRGSDENSKKPIATQYNYIAEAGTGNGSLARPLIQSTATKGVWSTYSNKAYDLSLLMGQLVSKGYNLASTVIFYPAVAFTPMSLGGSAAKELSPIEYLNAHVLGCIAMPDSYLYTLAGALPTAALFDLYAIDLNQVDIGVSRAERVLIIPPFGTTRSTTLQGEFWFVPWLKPNPWADDGKTYKGVSRITAIAP